MLKRITEILDVKPYEVLCRWNTGEVRVIQLETSLREWAAPEGSHYRKLLDPSVFMSVQLMNRTLGWYDIILPESGALKEFDLDPETLYRMSKPVQAGMDSLSEAA